MEEQQIYQSHASAGNSKNSLNEHQSLSSRRVMMRRTNIMLPDDIIYYNILIRLPAKFLVRFRLVCKSWEYNLSTSEFVKAHLTHQQSNKDQDLLIGKPWSSRVVFITRSSEIPVTVGPLRTEILLGSINGLVCMASGTDFSLWNPATGQAKEINLPNHDCTKCRHLLGFSWDHVEDDYKVVILCYVSGCSSIHLYIYSYRSACWNRLIVSRKEVPDERMFEMTPSTIVKGLPYWSRTIDRTRRMHISSKKRTRRMYAYIHVFTKDKMRLLRRLEFDCFKCCQFNLVNIKDSLVGMVYKSDCRDSSVDMYSLDNESDCGVWSKICTIGPKDFGSQNCWQLKCFKNGGEILIVNNNGQLCFYNHKTLETKIIRSSRAGIFRSCYSYTPSLVSVEGMESIVVLPFQEMELNKLALEYSNCLVSDSSSSTDSSSDSGTSGSDSDSETSSDSGTSSSSEETSSDSGTSSGSDSNAETSSDSGTSSSGGSDVKPSSDSGRK